MPTWTRYFLIGLLILFFGLAVYLGYQYSVETKKIGAGKSGGLGSKETTLTGQVLLGANTDLPMAFCDTQYYLVSGKRATWLVAPSETAAESASELSKYKYSEVEASGQSGEKVNPCIEKGFTNCGCDDYLVVDNVSVVKEGKLLGEEYEGQIICQEGVEATVPGTCIPNLKIEEGNVYPLSLTDESGYTRDMQGARVKVLGIVKDDYIDVFEITKVE